jgi:hypothetical protein
MKPIAHVAQLRALLRSGELIAQMRKVVPRCLTVQQRERAHLAPEPPSTCIETGKWPCHGQEWKDWLVARQAGKTVAVPIER